MGNSMTCLMFTPPFGFVRLWRILRVIRTHRGSFPSLCLALHPALHGLLQGALPLIPALLPCFAHTAKAASRYAQACFTSGLTCFLLEQALRSLAGQTFLRRASLPGFHQRRIKRTFTLLNRVPCGKFNRVNFRYTIPPIWAGLIALRSGFPA
jgi:hypothetical protein